MIEVAFKYMAYQKGTPLNKDGVQAARRSNPNWSKAFELLRYELARIKATNVIIEAGYKPNQVRADGWPYSNAKPEHSQVRVSFERSGTPIAFLQVGFKAVEYNVWLIAMTLQALRAVDRYGCSQSGEQYKGWAQLPPGKESIAAAEWSSVEYAMRFLCQIGNGEVLSLLPADLDVVYRAAARKAHPDAGGSNELMAKVNRAKDYIERAVRA